MIIIKWLILGLALLISAFVAVISYCLLKVDLKTKAKERYSKIRDENFRKTEEDSDKKLAYTSMEDKLLSQGIKYRMGDSFSPFDYTVFRMIVCLGAGILGLLYQPWLGIMLILLAYFGVPFYFKHEDQTDNDDMLSDIGQMNSIVALQVKNGVFLSKVIYECYRATSNQRLKKALLELSIDIENFSSISDAANNFRKKFNNKHIDMFAKTLEQVQESGQSAQLFEDLVSSVKGINEAIAIKEEARTKRIGFFFETLLFLAPMIFIFYVVITMLGSTALLM